jgi:Fe-S-cluster containining protein
MPVEIEFSDLVRLGLADPDEEHRSKKKLVRRLEKAGYLRSFREGTGLFMLAQQDQTACVFLNLETRLCSVYDKRPDVCRKFPSIGPRPGFCPYKRKTADSPRGFTRS